MSVRLGWSMRIAVGLSAVLLLGLAKSPAFRASDESSVTFECFGKRIEKPAKGRFATVISELVIDPQDLSHVRGRVAVELSSVVTEDATWDVFFRAAPFLGIQEYPRSSFELVAVEGARSLPRGKTLQLKARGRFSLKGETRELTFPARVRYTPSTRTEPERVHVKGRFKILWKDYGVRIPSGAAAGFAGEGTSVGVDLKFERMRPRPAKVTRKRMKQ